MLRIYFLKPLVLTVIADHRRAGTEIVSVDVQVPLFIEVSAQVTRVLSVVLVSKREGIRFGVHGSLSRKPAKQIPDRKLSRRRFRLFLPLREDRHQPY